MSAVSRDDPWIFRTYAGFATPSATNARFKQNLAKGQTTDLITWTVREIPRWNPINVCSYHLQEAGAGPVLEVAFTLANAIAVLDAVRATGRMSEEEFPGLVGRISFFCNAGIRFVEE